MRCQAKFFFRAPAGLKEPIAAVLGDRACLSLPFGVERAGRAAVTSGNSGRSLAPPAASSWPPASSSRPTWDSPTPVTGTPSRCRPWPPTASSSSSRPTPTSVKEPAGVERRVLRVHAPRPRDSVRRGALPPDARHDRAGLRRHEVQPQVSIHAPASDDTFAVSTPGVTGRLRVLGGERLFITSPRTQAYAGALHGRLAAMSDERHLARPARRRAHGVPTH
jgi:hypothetical protein